MSNQIGSEVSLPKTWCNRSSWPFPSLISQTALVCSSLLLGIQCLFIILSMKEGLTVAPDHHNCLMLLQLPQTTVPDTSSLSECLVPLSVNPSGDTFPIFCFQNAVKSIPGHQFALKRVVSTKKTKDTMGLWASEGPRNPWQWLCLFTYHMPSLPPSFCLSFLPISISSFLLCFIFLS